MIRERWKPVEDYEDQYEISNLGRIKTLDKKCYGRIMSLEIDRSDYYVVRLVKHGVPRRFAVHRLVYSHFRESIGEGDVIHHIDENKLNNAINNLMKMTVS